MKTEIAEQNSKFSHDDFKGLRDYVDGELKTRHPDYFPVLEKGFPGYLHLEKGDWVVSKVMYNKDNPNSSYLFSLAQYDDSFKNFSCFMGIVVGKFELLREGDVSLNLSFVDHSSTYNEIRQSLIRLLDESDQYSGLTAKMNNLEHTKNEILE